MPKVKCRATYVRTYAVYELRIFCASVTAMHLLYVAKIAIAARVILATAMCKGFFVPSYLNTILSHFFAARLMF